MTLSDYFLDTIRKAIERPEPGGAAEAAARAVARVSVGVAGGRSAGGARGTVIVVDASALLELLLRTSAAQVVETR